ncbi:hypothetical protein H2203_000880 [Taxawa tesnikishii (nom. ined.)]|nr:hypothetical protein H2203_000880 [Dothideales sp. JES 119]
MLLFLLLVALLATVIRALRNPVTVSFREQSTVLGADVHAHTNETTGHFRGRTHQRAWPATNSPAPPSLFGLIEIPYRGPAWSHLLTSVGSESTLQIHSDSSLNENEDELVGQTMIAIPSENSTTSSFDFLAANFACYAMSKLDIMGDVNVPVECTLSFTGVKVDGSRVGPVYMKFTPKNRLRPDGGTGGLLPSTLSASMEYADFSGFTALKRVDLDIVKSAIGLWYVTGIALDETRVITYTK